jgi:hypothetical protein
MKVDFLASYKQVQKYINAKGQQPAPAPEFQQELQIAEPQKDKQVVDNTEQMQKIKQALEARVPGPRAALDLPRQELFLPTPEFDRPTQEIVKDSAQAVKSPTGVQARLIKGANSFDGLSAQERHEAVGALVAKAGYEHGIDPKLSLGVIKAESNFNPVAVSQDGFESKGLMQLLDSTGTEMMDRLGIEDNYSPFDPAQNVELGVGYLKRLHTLFSADTLLAGNLKTFAAANSSSLEKLAVAAYNAGEGRVASAQHRASKRGKDPGVYSNIEAYLPEITQQYVKKVIQHRANLELKGQG